MSTADDAVERVLAEFRHEAATPIALMESALRQLDRRADLDADARGLVEVAHRQAEVLVQLLGRLRDADERTDLVADPHPHDLGDLVTQTVTDLRLGLLEGRDCRVATDETVPVRVDEVLLRRALINLLDNAVKYSPDDTVINVTAERNGDEATVWVEDQGDGVAPEDQQEIFRRFERRSEHTDGLGLGLAIVQRVVEAHDGTVRAIPAPSGGGTRFVVALPLADVTA